MIEDELHLRATRHQIDGFLNLVPADAEVMREAEFGQGAQAAGEGGLPREAGRFILVQAADADDRRTPAAPR